MPTVNILSRSDPSPGMFESVRVPPPPKPVVRPDEIPAVNPDVNPTVIQTLNNK